MTPRAGLLAALLCLPATAVRGAEPAAPAAPAAPSGPAAAERSPAAVLDEVSGTVQSVDRTQQVITIATGGGSVDVRLDRNTLVYQPGGATTVLSIQPGATVRSGVDSARRAFWVQLRPREAAAPPAAATPVTPAPAPATAAPAAPEPKP
jgi:hypothetical protein